MVDIQYKLHGRYTIQVTWKIQDTSYMVGIQYKLHGRYTIQVTW